MAEMTKTARKALAHDIRSVMKGELSSMMPHKKVLHLAMRHHMRPQDVIRLCHDLGFAVSQTPDAPEVEDAVVVQVEMRPPVQDAVQLIATKVAAPIVKPVSDQIKRTIMSAGLFKLLREPEPGENLDDMYVLTTYGALRRERNALKAWLKEGGRL